MNFFGRLVVKKPMGLIGWGFRALRPTLWVFYHFMYHSFSVVMKVEIQVKSEYPLH